MTSEFAPKNVLSAVGEAMRALYLDALMRELPNCDQIGEAAYLAIHHTPIWSATPDQVTAFKLEFARAVAQRRKPVVPGMAVLVWPDESFSNWQVDAIRRQGTAAVIDVSHDTGEEHLGIERDVIACNTDGTFTLISDRTVAVYFS